jgi:propionyl-CoA carboxylase alpha chain
MGIKTVVYSIVDRDAPHVKFADEAVCIGEALRVNPFTRK